MSHSPQQQQSIPNNSEITTMSSRSSQEESFHYASDVTLLLSNYDKFGLMERVFYHWELLNVSPDGDYGSMENKDEIYDDEKDKDMLTNTMIESKSNLKKTTCGIKGLLNVQFPSTSRIGTKFRKKMYRHVREFNVQASQFHSSQSSSSTHVSSSSSSSYSPTISCYTPNLQSLPIQIGPYTRLTVAYDTLSMILCIPATSSMTRTFTSHTQSEHSSPYLFPLDKLGDTCQKYFQALIQPMHDKARRIFTTTNTSRHPNPNNNHSSSGNSNNKNNNNSLLGWSPQLSITVIAILPTTMTTTSSSSSSTQQDDIMVLVRDYKVVDVSSAQYLAERIMEWVKTDVEHEITSSMYRSATNTATPSITNRNITNPADSLRMQQQQKYRYTSLSMSNILNMAIRTLQSSLPVSGRPCVVLATDGRSIPCPTILDYVQNTHWTDIPLHILDLSEEDDSTILMSSSSSITTTWHGSDDREALFELCRISRGCYIDGYILQEGSQVIAGNVPSHSSFSDDHSFCQTKRTFISPNAIQWYTWFQLSPCTCQNDISYSSIPMPRFLLHRSRYQNLLEKRSELSVIPALTPVFMMSYKLSNIRMKEILLMRLKDGFIPRRYNYNNIHDIDKVSIVLSLKLENDCSILYEITSKHHTATVKLSLVASNEIINLVKETLTSLHSKLQQTLYFSVAQEVSYRISTYLFVLRDDDYLRSQLYPQEYTELLKKTMLNNKSSHESHYFYEEEYRNPLVASSHASQGLLPKLDRNMLDRHFQKERLDIILRDDDDSLGYMDFSRVSSLTHESLIRWLRSWTSLMIVDSHLYIKILPPRDIRPMTYLLVRVQPSSASRIFTLDLLFYHDIGVVLRERVTSQVKESLSICGSIIVSRPIRHLLAPRPSNADDRNQRLLCHESWILPKDLDLLYLVTKTRVAIENYFVLDDRDTLKLFGKYLTNENDPSVNKSYFVQYLIAILQDTFIVHFYFERKEGVFVNLTNVGWERIDDKLCSAMSAEVRNRDYDLSSYLISRSNLLRVYEANAYVDKVPTSIVDLERLAKCTTHKISLNLRFFQQADLANRILAKQTENLLQSELFNTPVKRLILDDSNPIAELTQGIWFLVRHDWKVLTLVHFSSEDALLSDNTIHRKLTFLTSNIDYLGRGIHLDGLDDPLTPDILDFISNLHKQNFAKCAYEALRMSPGEMDLHHLDFQYVLGICTEIKVLNNFYFSAFSQKIIDDGQRDSTPQSESETVGSKFSTLLEEILRPIPYGGGIYYYIGEDSEEFVDSILLSVANKHCEESTQSSYSQSSVDIDSSSHDEVVVHLDSSASDDSVLGDSDISSEILSFQSCGCITPPVFVRFASAGSSLSVKEIRQLGRRSCEIDAYITVFSDSKRLLSLSITQQSLLSPVELSSIPRLHSAVVVLLETRLKSVIAEQTLERLHYYFDSFSDTEVRILKKCFMDAKSVVTYHLPVFLFSVSADSMIDASTCSSCDSDFEHGFTLLALYLKSQIDLRSFRNGVFVSTNPYGAWCYIKVPETYGPISVQVFHPKGVSDAEIIVKQITLILKKCLFQVNQELLLRSLHMTRNAHDLLFTNDAQDPKAERQLEEYDCVSFCSNFFQCPVVFDTSFPLNHRCPVSQVIMSLESTILHNFAVSNRPGKFVYKDEKDKIFYLALEPKVNETNILTLLVYGINSNVGPAITSHLTKLVGKKLLSMGVDALSLLLMKNPHFNLLPADLSFLRSFQSVWKGLETDEITTSVERNEIIYQLPAACYDPILLLMFFRQNISGSTFFHIRNDPPSNDDASAVIEYDSSHHDFEADRGASFYFREKDFALYFNASPAQLDPTFQPITTLTEAGIRFSRLCGVGIALIDVKVVRHDDLESKDYFIGRLPTEDVSNLIPDFDSIKLKRVTDLQHFERNSYGISISIVNTTLDVLVLHRWIELSLTQALNGWVIENHIEKARLGLLKERELTTAELSDRKYHEIDVLCPGLPLLGCILHLTHQLPNPTVKRCDYYGQLKATSLIGITVSLLETCLLPSLVNDRKCSLSDVKNVIIIRISKNKCSSLQIRRDPVREKLLMYDSETDEKLCDHHDDNPEYICAYDLLPSRGLAKHSTTPATSLLFQKVFIEDYLTSDDRGSLPHALKILKTKNPSAFVRRITFILTVTRTARSVLFYNWNPSVFQSAIGKIADLHEQYIHDEHEGRMIQQRRCIRHIHFQNTVSLKPHDTSTQLDPTREKSESTTTTSNLSSLSAETSKGRAQRLSILKPTLVGKSVEGAAMQAMALSRAKASAKPAPSNKTKTAATNIVTADNKVSGHKKESPASLPLHKNQIERVQLSHIKDTNHPLYQATTLKDLLHHIPWDVIQSVSRINVAEDDLYRIFRPPVSFRILQSLYFLILTDANNRAGLGNIWDLLSQGGTALGIKNFPLLQSTTTNTYAYLLDFLANSVASDAQAQLISVRAIESHPSSILLFTNLMSPNLALVYELAIHKHHCSLHTYLFENLFNRLTGNTQPSSVALQKRENISISYILETMATTSLLAHFHVCRIRFESYPLKFASTLLKASAHGYNLESLKIPELLREMMPLLRENVPRPTGLQYSLLHSIGHYPTFAHGVGERIFSIGELVQDICQQPLLYKTNNCSSSELCISMIIPPPTVTIASIAFLLPLKNNSDGYDLFVLCCVQGIDMNSFVRDGFSPWAQKLSDHLLQKANSLVHRIFDKATKNIWKDRLWNKYTLAQPDTKETVRELVTLRSLCTCVHISQVDQRFSSLLFGQDSHFHFNFNDMKLSMKSESIFSNWTEISSSETGMTTHFIYFEGEHSFLILYQDQDGLLTQCEVMLKYIKDDPIPLISVLGNFCLLWIFNNADVL